ncbi:MAG: tRNA (N(6)-L-threonylcarbamoyladenosine(37)-C(2))-methylthiotransferase MtaB [Lamprobacter sp.]|uniref:tRNA (N(6)-L-threonylcarbamoyladenosine(37)-C(2))- methylthiotransferase MtaB n=1 Tax=Lamprobacter sp. TaxID=3100796 RepID=UPI002B257675|nr:tRNA (N(6)-L-threonylcarbamoyladenosine(37)-C(2))-methylthiotransferase MtaB [Lamprobacter sp.]MEA3638983.1 tRNA (N(6)-L-threonylcarbamoyladenosine(37)-C(2))-methylthiotransferase MtaB [Lamprobacter sp.]
MRVKLSTLGCRLNEAELAGWSRELEARGCRISGEGDAADLLVVNTCAVTAEAMRKSRKLLRRLQREYPRARLVVSGCAVSLKDSQLGELGIDLMVPNQDKDRLVSIAAETLALPLMPEAATEPGAAALFARGRQRAFVKIQDGCRYECSFCITTRARGEERSRPIAEICREINQLVADGIQEVVLTGVHAAGYGSDCGSSLSALLAAVLQDTDAVRVRLGSVEPWDVPERFWQLFDDARLMPHLHLPLQSGADSVLKRMARRCKTAAFARLVELARGVHPNFNITTDIIVGFPGETETEWAQTLAFVEQTGFGGLHIFSYSPRAGTRAAEMPDQVPTAVKRARSRELHALGQRLKRAWLERQVGSVQEVLIEGCESGQPAEAWLQIGYTPGYLLTRLATAGIDLSNQILPLRIDRVIDPEEADPMLEGQPVNYGPQ